MVVISVGSYYFSCYCEGGKCFLKLVKLWYPTKQGNIKEIAMYFFLIVVLASYFNVNYHFLFGLKIVISKWNYDDISAYLSIWYKLQISGRDVSRKRHVIFMRILAFRLKEDNTYIY